MKFAITIFALAFSINAHATSLQPDVLVDHKGEASVRTLLSGQNNISISGEAARKLFNDLEDSEYSSNLGGADSNSSTVQRVGENITCNKHFIQKSKKKAEIKFQCDISIDPKSGKAELGAVG